MPRFLYSLLTYVLLPLMALYLFWRSRKQPEYRQHWAERFGLATPQVAAGCLWIHAVSLGETLAVESLVKALRARYPTRPILLTHTTPTGRAAGQRLASRVSGVIVGYLPYDTPLAMGRFVARVRPALGLLMETEVWPNLVAACQGAGVPLALINARLSEKSLARGGRYAGLAREALQGLSLVLAQTAEDARRLAELGARSPQVLGNLKFDIEPAPGLVQQGRVWRSQFPQRKVLLLANTREGEEALFLKAMARQAWADCLILLVPRHPQRFDAVAREVQVHGWRFARRSEVLPSGPSVGSGPAAKGLEGAGHGAQQGEAGAAGRIDVQLLLGDSLGEMPSYYAAADLCIMGGSFAPLGGHNLIEACACHCPVILGPHTFNFSLVSEQAIAAAAAWRVGDALAALDLAHALLDKDRQRLQAAAAACTHFAGQHQGATARTLAALSPLLP